MYWIRLEAILALASDEIAATIIFFLLLPLVGIHPPLSLYVAIIGVLVAKDAVIVKLIWNVLTKPPQTGKDTLVGERGIAQADMEKEGMVKIRNELWKAETLAPLKKGARVRVVRADGLFLVVEPEDEGGGGRSRGAV